MNKLNGDISLAAIVLAAGEGSRFGKPKWQGEFQGKTFLETIQEKLILSGFSDIICVKQKSFDIKIENLLYVDNPTPELGMISSLYYALKSYPEFKGYLILPVDHPMVDVHTIKKLKSAFNPEKCQIVRPVFNSFPGHPIVIKGKLFSILKTPCYSGGLRQLIKDSGFKVLDVKVNDPNILKNVNYSSDLDK
ncbi:MAG TPA: hypothetical protein DD381_09745 [Lentisphaeria bacterium]|nr:MAG: hypothetical protein A2X47_09695 [Lentisphaerae bacterium GWF2_38_69]HBM16607.1 hypothetical protein [Lentisphaeria bacterium]